MLVCVSNTLPSENSDAGFSNPIKSENLSKTTTVELESVHVRLSANQKQAQSAGASISGLNNQTQMCLEKMEEGADDQFVKRVSLDLTK